MESTRMATQANAHQGEQPFSDCFARSCRHLVDGHCGIYTATRPPTITVDGRCLGYDQ